MMNEHIKHATDAAAAAGTVGAFLGYLPSIAAGATLVWTLIRIYETHTVQKLLKRV